MDTRGFIDPSIVVKNLSLKPNDRVVDMGAGSGAFTFACAEYVGELGRVYAVDIQKDLLTRITNTARQKNFQNIDTLWTDIEQPQSTKFTDGIIDLVILSNILFQLPDRKTPLTEALRIVKPDGHIVIVDWMDSYNGLGPPPEQVFTRDAAIAFVDECGGVCTQEFDPGEHHWGLVCTRSTQPR